MTRLEEAEMRFLRSVMGYTILVVIIIIIIIIYCIWGFTPWQ